MTQKAVDEKSHEEILTRIRELEEENRELQEELAETSRGTLALYNEIESVNKQLEKKHEELENKNKELAQALRNLKESEQGRTEAVRTAAIGSIVVTYNHEINNPLAVIFGSIDLMMLDSENLPESMKNNLGKISRASIRIRDVIQKIKEYEKLLPKNYLNWDMLDLHNNDE